MEIYALDDRRLSVISANLFKVVIKILQAATETVQDHANRATLRQFKTGRKVEIGLRVAESELIDFKTKWVNDYTWSTMTSKKSYRYNSSKLLQECGVSSTPWRGFAKYKNT